MIFNRSLSPKKEIWDVKPYFIKKGGHLGRLFQVLQLINQEERAIRRYSNAVISRDPLSKPE